jgi:phosphonate transport system ATP-binding protein
MQWSSRLGIDRSMLEMRDLKKSFGATLAVDGVSLSIAPGSMTAIIGSSGAGKTTLLRMINRLVDPDSGDILWGGESMSRVKGAKLRGWRRRCAMIFQQYQLAPRLDVLTNVLVGSLHGRPVLPSLIKSFPKNLRARAVLELDALGMAPMAFQRVETLSGGQQQRVAIARAMMQNPEVLLADEPVASLDPANADLVMDALTRINRERGITVLVNLHSTDIVRRYCASVVGMSRGRVVFDGACQNLDAHTLDRIYNAPARSEADKPRFAAA